MLLEKETSGGDFTLDQVEHVEGGVERARERALELAKECDDYGWPKGARSVFRIGDDTFMAVVTYEFNGRTMKARFRVSVGELVHTEEWVEEAPVPDESKKRRGILRRKNEKTSARSSGRGLEV